MATAAGIQPASGTSTAGGEAVTKKPVSTEISQEAILKAAGVQTTASGQPIYNAQGGYLKAGESTEGAYTYSGKTGQKTAIAKPVAKTTTPNMSETAKVLKPPIMEHGIAAPSSIQPPKVETLGLSGIHYHFVSTPEYKNGEVVGVKTVTQPYTIINGVSYNLPKNTYIKIAPGEKTTVGGMIEAQGESSFAVPGKITLSKIANGVNMQFTPSGEAPQIFTLEGHTPAQIQSLMESGDLTSANISKLSAGGTISVGGTTYTKPELQDIYNIYMKSISSSLSPSQILGIKSGQISLASLTDEALTNYAKLSQPENYKQGWYLMNGAMTPELVTNTKFLSNAFTTNNLHSLTYLTSKEPLSFMENGLTYQLNKGGKYQLEYIGAEPINPTEMQNYAASLQNISGNAENILANVPKVSTGVATQKAVSTVTPSTEYVNYTFNSTGQVTGYTLYDVNKNVIGGADYPQPKYVTTGNVKSPKIEGDIIIFPKNYPNIQQYIQESEQNKELTSSESAIQKEFQPLYSYAGKAMKFGVVSGNPTLAVAGSIGKYFEIPAAVSAETAGLYEKYAGVNVKFNPSEILNAKALATYGANPFLFISGGITISAKNPTLAAKGAEKFGQAFEEASAPLFMATPAGAIGAAASVATGEASNYFLGGKLQTPSEIAQEAGIGAISGTLLGMGVTGTAPEIAAKVLQKEASVIGGFALFGAVRQSAEKAISPLIPTGATGIPSSQGQLTQKGQYLSSIGQAAISGGLTGAHFGAEYGGEFTIGMNLLGSATEEVSPKLYKIVQPTTLMGKFELGGLSAGAIGSSSAAMAALSGASPSQIISAGVATGIAGFVLPFALGGGAPEEEKNPLAETEIGKPTYKVEIGKTEPTGTTGAVRIYERTASPLMAPQQEEFGLPERELKVGGTTYSIQGSVIKTVTPAITINEAGEASHFIFSPEYSNYLEKGFAREPSLPAPKSTIATLREEESKLYGAPMTIIEKAPILKGSTEIGTRTRILVGGIKTATLGAEQPENIANLGVSFSGKGVTEYEITKEIGAGGKVVTLKEPIKIFTPEQELTDYLFPRAELSKVAGEPTPSQVIKTGIVNPKTGFIEPTLRDVMRATYGAPLTEETVPSEAYENIVGRSIPKGELTKEGVILTTVNPSGESVGTTILTKSGITPEGEVYTGVKRTNIGGEKETPYQVILKEYANKFPGEEEKAPTMTIEKVEQSVNPNQHIRLLRDRTIETTGEQEENMRSFFQTLSNFINPPEVKAEEITPAKETGAEKTTQLQEEKVLPPIPPEEIFNELNMEPAETSTQEYIIQHPEVGLGERTLQYFKTPGIEKYVPVVGIFNYISPSNKAQLKPKEGVETGFTNTYKYITGQEVNQKLENTEATTQKQTQEEATALQNITTNATITETPTPTEPETKEKKPFIEPPTDLLIYANNGQQGKLMQPINLTLSKPSSTVAYQPSLIGISETSPTQQAAQIAGYKTSLAAVEVRPIGEQAAASESAALSGLTPEGNTNQYIPMPGYDVLSPLEQQQIEANLAKANPTSAKQISESLLQNYARQSGANSAALRYENEILQKFGKQMSPAARRQFERNMINQINTSLYYVTPAEYNRYVKGFNARENLPSQVSNPSERQATSEKEYGIKHKKQSPFTNMLVHANTGLVEAESVGGISTGQPEIQSGKIELPLKEILAREQAR